MNCNGGFMRLPQYAKWDTMEFMKDMTTITGTEVILRLIERRSVPTRYWWNLEWTDYHTMTRENVSAQNIQLLLERAVAAHNMCEEAENKKKQYRLDGIVPPPWVGEKDE
jgi:hypothetical protein